jgi:hypothetical protein
LFYSIAFTVFVKRKCASSLRFFLKKTSSTTKGAH